MSKQDEDAEHEQFWAALEERICAQINEIDDRIADLYKDRDRLQFFLNDHGRRCSK